MKPRQHHAGHLPRGVSYDAKNRAGKKYKARLFYNGRDRFLGRFTTAAAAEAAYQAALAYLKGAQQSVAPIADPELERRLAALKESDQGSEAAALTRSQPASASPASSQGGAAAVSAPCRVAAPASAGGRASSPLSATTGCGSGDDASGQPAAWLLSRSQSLPSQDSPLGSAQRAAGGGGANAAAAAAAFSDSKQLVFMSASAEDSSALTQSTMTESQLEELLTSALLLQRPPGLLQITTGSSSNLDAMQAQQQFLQQQLQVQQAQVQQVLQQAQAELQQHQQAQAQQAASSAWVPGSLVPLSSPPAACCGSALAGCGLGGGAAPAAPAGPSTLSGAPRCAPDSCRSSFESPAPSLATAGGPPAAGADATGILASFASCADALTCTAGCVRAVLDLYVCLLSKSDEECCGRDMMTWLASFRRQLAAAGASQQPPSGADQAVVQLMARIVLLLAHQGAPEGSALGAAPACSAGSASSGAPGAALVGRSLVVPVLERLETSLMALHQALRLHAAALEPFAVRTVVTAWLQQLQASAASAEDALVLRLASLL